MMKWEEIKTPNSRLLYIKTSGQMLEWNELEARLTQFISVNAKLRLANDQTYLYFFQAMETQISQEALFWVGKEVIGLPQKDEGQIEMTDLQAGMAFRFPLTPQDIHFFYPEKLANIYETAKLSLKKASFTIADTWRIVIQEDIREGNMELRFFLDFFPDNPEF